MDIETMSTTGKKIKTVRLKHEETMGGNTEDHLYIEFDDYSELDIYDNKQTCCETRHMDTDDDLSLYSGETFVGLKLVDGGEKKEDGGVHEIHFLDVITDKGAFQISTHNEHNGYYGGFEIKVKYTKELEVEDGH